MSSDATLVEQDVGDHERLEPRPEARRGAANALGDGAELAVAPAQHRQDPVRFAQFVGAEDHDFVAEGGHQSIMAAASPSGSSARTAVRTRIPCAPSATMRGVDEPLFVIPLWADLTAVGLGGIQGALFASGFRGQRRLDLLGVAIIGIVMGMGGGLIRDLLLNVTPVTLQSNWYLLTATAAALVGMLLAGLFQRLNAVIVGLDALVIGLFGAFGTSKALALGFPLVPAVFVGVCSAVGGGILRDMIMGLPVAIMHVGSLYAVAAGAGCLVLATTAAFGVEPGPRGEHRRRRDHRHPAARRDLRHLAARAARALPAQGRRRDVGDPDRQALNPLRPSFRRSRGCPRSHACGWRG